jgi:hypothetical protein
MWTTAAAVGAMCLNAGRAFRAEERKVTNRTVQLVAADQIRCIECSEEWRPDETTLWRAYLTEELPPELILYCPSCAKREFDE